MDKSLIDADTLSPERKSLLPGAGFFILDEHHRQEKRVEIESTLADASQVVIADPDADGLACVALLREAVGDVALIPTGPHNLAEGLGYVAEFGNPDIDVYICDLCPDRLADIEPELSLLLEQAAAVRWYDHHQWDEEVAAAIRDRGIELTIGESDQECTADVLIRSLEYSFPDHLIDLATVTRDHDLWIKEDPRSDDLADFAQWTDDEETYVQTVKEHGADLPPDVQELLSNRRVEKEDRIERAVRRAEYREIGPWTVGVTYGRCSQNEVAEAMRQEGADASVVVKPSGAASIRGTDEFQRCHEVAGQVNGGGHPKAAGCKPDIFDDMLDYAHHWTSQGATVRQMIIEAFRSLPNPEQ